MAKKQIGDIDYNVEFNDSVLSTKTWNNHVIMVVKLKPKN